MPKKLTDTLRGVLLRTCIYFTCGVLAFALISALAGEYETPAVESGMLYLIFLFTLEAGVSDLILNVQRLPVFFRYFFHALLIIGGFWLIVITGGGISLSGSTLLYGLVFIAVIYTVFACIRAAVRHKAAAQKAETEKYTPMFTSGNRKDVSDNAAKPKQK